MNSLQDQIAGGARAHFLASRYGTPLMLPQRRGLIPPYSH